MTAQGITIEYIAGNCPVQSEGKVDGKDFYFRARGEQWSMSIGGDDVIGSPEWYYEEQYGDTTYEAGWMPQHDALHFMAKAFKMYLTRPINA